MNDSTNRPDSLRARQNRYRADITAAGAAYLQASQRLPFDALALQGAFTEDELAEAQRLLDSLADATDREQCQVQIVEHFASSGAVVLKLLRLAGLVV